MRMFPNALLSRVVVIDFDVCSQPLSHHGNYHDDRYFQNGWPRMEVLRNHYKSCKAISPNVLDNARIFASDWESSD